MKVGDVVLAVELGQAIDVHRPGGAAALLVSDVLGRVDRRCGSEDEGGAEGRRLQYVDRPGHVHRRSPAGIGLARRDEVDGGQVDHAGRADRVRHPLHRVPIRQVADVDGDLVQGELGEPAGAAGQAVENVDVSAPTLHESPHDLATDIAGAARHEEGFIERWREVHAGFSRTNEYNLPGRLSNKPAKVSAKSPVIGRRAKAARNGPPKGADRRCSDKTARKLSRV